MKAQWRSHGISAFNTRCFVCRGWCDLEEPICETCREEVPEDLVERLRWANSEGEFVGKQAARRAITEWLRA